MIRVFKRSDDILNGMGIKMPPEFFQTVKTENCHITNNNDGELSVSGNAENAMEKCRLILPTKKWTPKIGQGLKCILCLKFTLF
jgi:hypothetical protein